MLTSSDPLPAFTTLTAAPVLDLVVPVYNEERELAASVRRLHAHLTTAFPYSFRITIADNASTDGTLVVAENLCRALPDVRVVHVAEKGRGRALAAVWSASDANILAYTDVDLSTDLNGLLPLLAPLLSGHSDLAIGSRLAPSSRVVRGLKRELISRSYNLILRTALHAHFSDAQCGFKAIRAEVAHELLPLVRDTGWFFDTELLVLAERVGLRIHEVPVDWVDDPDSRVEIFPTAAADLRGVLRVGCDLARGRLPLEGVRSRYGRSAGVGARAGGGAGVGAGVSAGAAGTAGAAGASPSEFGAEPKQPEVQLQGLVVFALGWALTAAALAALPLVTHSPSHRLELVVLLAANVAATAVRFALFRSWIFRASNRSDITPTRRLP